ncbi:MAG TPA: MarR family winged helix-turn-helix transcriptional regulator [Spirochaetia bacterium]
MSVPELLLENQICFLVYRLEKEIMTRYRPLLKQWGLTYPQYLMMLVLWERDERSVGELCAILGLDTGTVSPLLRRMEKKGLVTRTRDRRDERTVMVALTAAGKALEPRVRSVPRAIAECLGLTPRSYAALRAQLQGRLAVVKTSGAGAAGSRQKYGIRL